MVNITGDENFTSERTLIGIITLSAGVNEFFAALNVFLAITSSLDNALILVALHKATSIYPPTKLFFRCLAVTDLCVGLVVQPLYVTEMLAPFTNMNWNARRSIFAARVVSGLILCGVSVLTSAAISVDRLLALLLGLRYRHVVTLRRVRVVIICLWFIAASTIIIPMDIAFKLASAPLLLLLVISIYCYTRILIKLRHQQAQVQNHLCQRQANGGGNSLQIARYKKSASSVLWVQLALVACYVPWEILNVLFFSAGIDNYVAWRVTLTLVYFNSSLNPILYCWKIRAVRQAAKDAIRPLNCLRGSD